MTDLTPGVSSTPLSRYRAMRYHGRSKALRHAMPTRFWVIWNVLRGRGVIYRVWLDGPIFLNARNEHVLMTESTVLTDGTIDAIKTDLTPESERLALDIEHHTEQAGIGLGDVRARLAAIEQAAVARDRDALVEVVAKGLHERYLGEEFGPDHDWRSGRCLGRGKPSCYGDHMDEGRRILNGGNRG